MNRRIRDGRFPAKRTGSQIFPATPETVADARRWVTELLRETHPACDDAVLLLSEAFTNSVRHSRGDTSQSSRSSQTAVCGSRSSTRAARTDPGQIQASPEPLA